MDKLKYRFENVFKKYVRKAKLLTTICLETGFQKAKLQLHCFKYKPEDVLNTGKTALFFKRKLEKIPCFANEDCYGGKRNKK